MRSAAPKRSTGAPASSPRGEPFDEVGIPHIEMALPLKLKRRGLSGCGRCARTPSPPYQMSASNA